MEKDKFIIVKDTRERNGGWDYPETDWTEGTLVQTVKTGDYTIRGMEHILCIERKKSVAELAGNVTQERFTRELERMQDFKYKFIICEFAMNLIVDFPEGANIPPDALEKVKLTPQYFMRRISQIQVNYGVNIIFAGSFDNAKYAAGNIMKRVYELEINGQRRRNTENSE